MRKLIVGFICLAWLAATSLQPARTQGTQPTGAPFRVALILGATGPTAAIMSAIIAGAHAAAKKVNNEGGVLGRPVEITVFDHQFDPARAVRIVQDDIATQHWDVISPTGGSTATLPMLPFVTKTKTLSLATVSSPDLTQITTDNPLFFGLQPSIADAARALADYVKKLGVKKLGVLYSSDGLGTITDKVFEAAVARVGIPVVSESYDIATIDITPTLLKLKAAEPDHLFVNAFGTPAGHVLNSLDKLGWDIPIIGDVAFASTNLTTMASPRTWSKLTVEQWRINAYLPPAQRSPKLNDFIARVKEQGPITQGMVLYAIGWDTIMLPTLAAKKANSTDAQKMADALVHFDLPTRQRAYMLYNQYVFPAADHQPQTDTSEYVFVPYTPFVDGMMGNTK